MAENSRMSKLSSKDDECIFSWKLFTGWDFMIGTLQCKYTNLSSMCDIEQNKNLLNFYRTCRNSSKSYSISRIRF